MVVLLLVLSVGWIGNAYILWIIIDAARNGALKDPKRSLFAGVLRQLGWTIFLINVAWWDNYKIYQLFIIIILATFLLDVTTRSKK
jgi:hypothetical protein